MRQLTILGHIVCKDDVRPNPEKLGAVTFPKPAIFKELRSFIGVLVYGDSFKTLRLLYHFSPKSSATVKAYHESSHIAQTRVLSGM